MQVLCVVSRALLVGKTFLGGHVGSPGGQGFPGGLTSLTLRPPHRISHATLSHTMLSNRGQAAVGARDQEGAFRKELYFQDEKGLPESVWHLKVCVGPWTWSERSRGDLGEKSMRFLPLPSQES